MTDMAHAAVDAAMLVWVRQTIRSELSMAEGLDPASELVRQLAAALLRADGVAFQQHVQANSSVKLAILDRCEQVLDDPGHGHARELAAEIARLLAYGYRFRRGWLPTWAPAPAADQ